MELTGLNAPLLLYVAKSSRGSKTVVEKSGAVRAACVFGLHNAIRDRAGREKRNLKYLTVLAAGPLVSEVVCRSRASSMSVDR